MLHWPRNFRQNMIYKFHENMGENQTVFTASYKHIHIFSVFHYKIIHCKRKDKKGSEVILNIILLSKSLEQIYM